MKEIINKPITAVMIGAGSRGKDSYGLYAQKHPDRLKFIAIAEPNETKRRIFQEIHQIPDDKAFSSWEELLSSKVKKIAQTAFICTPDRMHYQPAMKALELDYDLVLEKPIAPTLEECQNIAKLAIERNRLVQICHVLRFTDFWKKVKGIVDSGEIGNIIHYDHSENVSFWHFGHSFVRGWYKNKATSTPIALAKTCHDLDLIHWILNEKPIDVSSSGDLSHFKPENAPQDSPIRCTDGCPVAEECPWFAPRLYLHLEPVIRIGLYSKSKIFRGLTKILLKSSFVIKFLGLFNKDVRAIKNKNMFPTNTITTNLTNDGIMRALREGQFGLCIYKTGNDVPDHQISTFNFTSGATATLTMHGLSDHEGRELRIFGSKGTIRGIFRNSEEIIEVTDFLTGKIRIAHKVGLNLAAHGGGDEGIMNAFTSVMLGEKTKEEANLTDIFSAMESHFMGFAAEESRLTKTIQELSNYR
ncbi:MAG: Gfo/Idh/MocA family oxidoreductase [Asgard group archaeon]|nr:Gfo/Idh/MocA family oxidoreductase [Asgard group archaeon]